MNKVNIGRQGEALAKAYLVQNGYRILSLNWRIARLGELDIVAYEPNTQQLCFIEVKSRRSKRFGSALEAVTPCKQATIQALAQHYLQRESLDLPIQALSFDVITLESTGRQAGLSDIIHHRNAF